MHDYSLPAGDRCDGDGSNPQEKTHWPVHVLALAGSSYFRAFRRGNGVLTTKSIRHVALFGPAANEALERAQRKLKRLGIAGMIVNVRVIIGSTS